MKSCPECHRSWWVSNIILCSHGPVSSCVAVHLQPISEWDWEVVKLPKRMPGTKPVFWLRIFVQTNGSKPVLAHIGCNSLNIINSLLTYILHTWHRRKPWTSQVGVSEPPPRPSSSSIEHIVSFTTWTLWTGRTWRGPLRGVQSPVLVETHHHFQKLRSFILKSLWPSLFLQGGSFGTSCVF